MIDLWLGFRVYIQIKHPEKRNKYTDPVLLYMWNW